LEGRFMYPAGLTEWNHLSDISHFLHLTDSSDLPTGAQELKGSKPSRLQNFLVDLENGDL